MDLTTYPELVQLWYEWAVFAGVAVTFLVAVWIFSAAILRGRHSTLWQFISVVLLVLTLPGLLFWAAPSLSEGDLEKAVAPVAYIGLGAAVLALLVWLLFLVGVAVTSAYEPEAYPPYVSPYAPPPAGVAEQTQRPTVPAAPVAQPVQPPPPAAPPGVAPTVQVSSSPQPPYAPPHAAPAETEVLRREPARMGWLVITTGVWSGREFRLGEVTTIGRTGDCDIVLDDTGISRQHARVRLRDDQFVLHDLGSTNGTLVKDRETNEWEPIDRHVLQGGDQIKIGRVELSFMEIQPGSNSA
jgi:hypothetical protein